MPGIHNKASCDALGSGYTPPCKVGDGMVRNF
jgi:hypothetical protein